MQGLKSAIFQKSADGLNWPYPVSAALKKPSVELKNSFCFGFLWIPTLLEEKKKDFQIIHSKVGGFLTLSVDNNEYFVSFN